MVEDGRVHLRNVETGYVDMISVEILKGLSPGQQVVIDQLDRFREGDRVRPVLVERGDKK